MTCKVEGCPVPGHSEGQWWPMMDGPKENRQPWEPWAAFMEAAPGLTIGCTSNTEPLCRVSGYLVPVVANAALIARAPDLAHALVGLVKAAKDYKALEQLPQDSYQALHGIRVGQAFKDALAAAEAALKGASDA